MRYSSAILALPALALAQDQVPLADKVRGWFKQAQEYLPTAASVPSVIPNPVDAGASFVAEAVVHELNLTNWQSIVAPSPSAQTAGPEEWMIFLTGGNTTCYGLCGNVTKEWTVSLHYSHQRVKEERLTAETEIRRAFGSNSFPTQVRQHRLRDRTNPMQLVVRRSSFDRTRLASSAPGRPVQASYYCSIHPTEPGQHHRQRYCRTTH